MEWGMHVSEDIVITVSHYMLPSTSLSVSRDRGLTQRLIRFQQ